MKYGWIRAGADFSILNTATDSLIFDHCRLSFKRIWGKDEFAVRHSCPFLTFISSFCS